MSMVLDAGALIAVDRGDRELIALIKVERQAGRSPITHGGVIGQVWRGARAQHHLARALPALDVRAIDETLGRRAGVLCGATERSDVIDAAIVLVAQDGDEIYTSDTGDLSALAQGTGRRLTLIPV
ncbi:hypothetical protein BH23ACT2_BH23ACT2_28900 [soil metagenome]